MTECSASDSEGDNWSNDLIWDMQNLFIGGVNNWGEISLKWNLVLD